MRPNREHQTIVLCLPTPGNAEKLERKVIERGPVRIKKNREALIISPDPLIRAFLSEILTFQGYESSLPTSLHECLLEMIPSEGQMVFLDAAYLMGMELEANRHWGQELVQAGVKLVMVAEQQLGADLTSVLNIQGAQILWKPLDFRQVGEVMARIGYMPEKV